MRTRAETLDFIKVFSMILVIVIHVSNYYCRNSNEIISLDFISAMIYNGVSRICVPLFFMVSGALILGKEHDWEKYKARIIRLIIVLLFWSVIYCLWDALYMNYEYNIVQDAFKIFFEPVKVHLWFLYPLLGLYVIAPFIQKMLQGMDRKMENLFIILWIFLAGGVAVFLHYLELAGVKTKIIYAVPVVQGSYWLGYFVTGYILYKRRKENLFKNQNMKLIIAYVIGVVAILAGTFFESAIENKFIEELFIYRNLFIMISALSFFLIVITNENTLLKPRIKKIVRSLIPYSFGIYLSHLLFYNIVVKEFDILQLPSIFGVPIVSVCIFFTSYILCLIIKKIPFLKKVI